MEDLSYAYMSSPHFATANRRSNESKDAMLSDSELVVDLIQPCSHSLAVVLNWFFFCGIENVETPPASPREWVQTPVKVEDHQPLLFPRPSPLAAKDLVSAQHERALIKQAAGELSPTSVFAPSYYAEKPPPLDRTMVRARGSKNPSLAPLKAGGG